MKLLFKVLLSSAVVASLSACATPTTPAEGSDNNSNGTSDTASGINLDAGLNLGAGAGSTASGNANSSLTIDASGKTYTYGQIKSYYQCVATKSSNAAFKSTASAQVGKLDTADKSSDKDAKAAYTSAALGIASSMGYSGADCTP